MGYLRFDPESENKFNWDAKSPYAEGQDPRDRQMPVQGEPQSTDVFDQARAAAQYKVQNSTDEIMGRTTERISELEELRANAFERGEVTRALDDRIDQERATLKEWGALEITSADSGGLVVIPPEVAGPLLESLDSDNWAMDEAGTVYYRDEDGDILCEVPTVDEYGDTYVRGPDGEYYPV